MATTDAAVKSMAVLKPRRLISDGLDIEGQFFAVTLERKRHGRL